jgi:Zn ribbon nucleic-acid-binding protein
MQRKIAGAACYHFLGRSMALRLILMTEIPACKHEHTRLIAKDNEAEYIECVDCGVILERRELTEAPKNPAEPGKPSPFDESLSDA